MRWVVFGRGAAAFWLSFFHRVAPGARWYHDLALVARNPATWPGFRVCFVMSGSYMAFIGLWAVPYLVHAHGLPVVEATQHSLVNIGGFPAVALLQPLFGWMLDRSAAGAPYTSAHFVPGVALHAACAFLGLAAMLFIRETHCRNIWTDRHIRGRA